MTRHSKNCTASAVYSYHERSKDSRTSGYGTQKARLGRDSVREFDCCSLSLQPCRNPVVTPDGNLFDKEAIIEYIIGRKREIARQLKEWSKQQNREKEDLAALARAEEESKKMKFMEANSIKGDLDKAVPKQGSSIAFSTATPSLLIANEEAGTTKESKARAKEVPSFWIPSLTPDNKETKLRQKPDEKVRCPISGKPLRLKDLTEVKFERVPAAENKSIASKDGARYRCALTGDLLSNNSALVVLRTSGAVVTADAFERLIRPDMRDPRSGDTLTERDVIRLQRGASGFAASGLQLQARKETPVLQ